MNSSGYYATYWVARRAVGSTGWSSETQVSNATWQYSDTVTSGTAYEYRIRKYFSHSSVPDGAYTGYGYVQAGTNIPFVHQRGRVLLFVESGIASSLSSSGKLDLLISDLVGDGWVVTPITSFSKTDTPAQLRTRIETEHDPAETNPAQQVKAVFLLGNLPVPKAGNSNPDGHLNRYLPADSFYGTPDQSWGTPDSNGYPQSTIPGTVQLQVGRVDLSNLPVFTSDNELALLERYIEKENNFRHKISVPSKGALVGDGMGWRGGENPGADAFRNFAPLVGTSSGTVEVASTSSSTNSQRWLGKVKTDSYLWVWGSGGGGLSTTSPTTVDWLGDYNVHPDYHLVYSSDIATYGAKGTFYMMFASYLCDWSQQDSFLRVLLGTPDWGLASAWGARPFLHFHGMGLGETIGEGMRRSQNNSSASEYHTTVTGTLQGVHMGLMGDPTLRLQPVEPVSSLSVSVSGGTVSLDWNAPFDTAGVNGYYIYRASAAAGPYTLISGSSPHTSSDYSDAPSSGTWYYMVRVSKLQTSPSGTYYNGSQGIYTTATVSGGGSAPAAPSALSATASGSSTVNLAWTDNSSNETGFRIERSTDGTTYTEITTTSANAMSYSDTGRSASTTYYYRVRATNSYGNSSYTSSANATTTSGSSTWTGYDVGITGGSHSEGTPFRVTGAGADIYGTSDAFRFVAKQLTGDFTITTTVSSITAANGWAKAGLMAREGTGVSEDNAFVALSEGGASVFQARGTSAHPSDTDSTTGSWLWDGIMLRLERSGNVFTGKTSSDSGSTWTTITSYTIAMPSTIYVGLAFTSHDASTSAYADFTTPAVTGGTGGGSSWTGADIGITGGSHSEGPPFRVTGAGADIYGTSDAFRFVYKQLTGDFVITTTVSSITGTNDWAKAGLMAREGTGASDDNVFLALANVGPTVFQARGTSGYPTSTDSASGPWLGDGVMLRLERSGNVFTGKVSSDSGSTWTTIASHTVAMPSTINVGLAFTSHDSGSGSSAYADFSTPTITQ